MYEGKKVIMVMAHPDDEVIFGFPMIKFTDKILIVSNDKNNPDRAWCKDRYIALEKVGKRLGIPVESMDYPSEFYRLPTRKGQLSDFINEVLDKVKDYDVIYTHNPLGEYGHLDHQLVHTICMQSGKDVLFSNIFLKSNWCPYWCISSAYATLYYNELFECENDMDLYTELEDIYRDMGIWTWSKEPVKGCTVYMVKGDGNEGNFSCEQWLQGDNISINGSE